MKYKITIILLITAFLFSAADAADKGIKRKSAAEYAGAKRTALVIGNASYAKGRLKNPVNDARDMAAALEKLGFEVVLGTDRNYEQMYAAVRDFGDRLKKGNRVGLFYYSGHGIQVNGVNYLLPVDADIEREDEVHFRALPANLVLNKMKSAANPLNLVILDACRNNPYTRSWRRGREGGGLASMSGMIPPTGVLIFYATNPAGTAEDGYGRNSPFTASLKKRISQPDVELRKLVSLVAGDVIRTTGSKQHPWQEGMVLGDFYFADSGGTTTVTPPKPAEPVPPKTGSLTVKADVSGAVVWVNGTKYREAPMTFTINQTGEYTVKVTAEGYQPYTKRERVELGAEVTVTAYLEKIKPPVSVAPSPVVSTRKDDISNSLGMKFVYIEPGTFIMGSPEDEPKRDSDEKQHRVTLTKGFYMQTTEVTQGQWKALMGNPPPELKFKNCGDDCPVERVSWNDVQEFIKKLNRQGDGSYRLPTEAEWEYAARAGSSTAFAFGKCLSTDQANYDGNYPMPGCGKGKYRKTTVAVGSFAPNAWGLYDMHGNVYEWCQDWKGNYPSGAVTDPQGPSSGSYRVERGGGWYGFAQYCRSAIRNFSSPDARVSNLGFRLLRTP